MSMTFERDPWTGGRTTTCIVCHASITSGVTVIAVSQPDGTRFVVGSCCGPDLAGGPSALDRFLASHRLPFGTNAP